MSVVIDPAAAEEAMFASDWAVFTDGETAEIAGWDDGPMPDPWRHATDITGQSVTPVDAEPDRDS